MYGEDTIDTGLVKRQVRRFKSGEKDIGHRPSTADQPRQQRRSGVLRERFYNQFTAICTDGKVKTTNSKGSAKLEDELSLPSAWQRQHQAEHQSARTGSNCNSGADYSLSSSLQSDLAPSDLTSFDFLKDALRGHRFVDDPGAETACARSSQRCNKEFYVIGIQSLMQRWKSVLIMTETWWKNNLISVLGCIHDTC